MITSRHSLQVTWLRVGDMSVLSVGEDAFASDPRISILHIARPRIQADDWTLVINQTEEVDTGQYECSVNTLPKEPDITQIVKSSTDKK